jgi:hypothetical protein
MTRARTMPCLAALACLLAGCAPLLGQTRDPAYQGNGSSRLHTAGSTLVYQDSVDPLSYRSPPGALAKRVPVRGEACQSAVTLPFGLILAAFEAGNAAAAPAFVGAGWGDGGYARAVSAASASAPGARLVDVRADLHTTIVLGIWRQQCVEVSAAAVPVEASNALSR